MENIISNISITLNIRLVKILPLFILILFLFYNYAEAQSTNQNYVRFATPRRPISNLQTLETNVGNFDALQIQYLYYDQQGRNVQTVGCQQSPSGKDVIQFSEYDLLGRQPKQWLPYTISNSQTGAYRANGSGEDLNFYSGTQNIPQTAIPYSRTVFDGSSLNRPLEQGYPGETWQIGSGHSVKTTYGTNSSGEIRLWTISSSGSGASYTTYNSGTLLTTIITDENGSSATQYKDYSGKLVAKKVQSGSSSFLITDYIYDDAGNLQYVIPPLPSTPSPVTLPTSFAESDPVFLNFFYANHYDGRNRLIEKKYPVKDGNFLSIIRQIK